MRILLLLVLVLVWELGCASQKANEPPPQTAMDAVQLRACESCRHELELCRRRAERALEGQSGSACMDEFMRCIGAQQLDTARCAGLN